MSKSFTNSCALHTFFPATWLLPLLMVGIMLTGCGKRPLKEGQASDKTPVKVPTNATEMAYERDTDPVYREKLTKLGEARNKKVMALRSVRAQMIEIERAANTNANDTADYKSDPQWVKLNEEAEKMQQEVMEAQASVQQCISERLKEQYAAMAAAGLYERPVMPPRPNPADYPANTNLLLWNMSGNIDNPKIVSPDRPQWPQMQSNVLEKAAADGQQQKDE